MKVGYIVKSSEIPTFRIHLYCMQVDYFLQIFKKAIDFGIQISGQAKEKVVLLEYSYILCIVDVGVNTNWFNEMN